MKTQPRAKIPIIAGTMRLRSSAGTTTCAPFLTPKYPNSSATGRNTREQLLRGPLPQSEQPTCCLGPGYDSRFISWHGRAESLPSFQGASSCRFLLQYTCEVNNDSSKVGFC